MTSALFFIIRCVAILILLQSIVSSMNDGVTLRDVSFWGGILLFLAVSYLYEKKRKMFSVGFLYYFIVVFLANLWGPYRYIKDAYILSLNEVKPNDHYWIFFTITSIVSLLILIYLLCVPANKSLECLSLDTSKLQLKQLYISMLMVFPVWYVSSNEVMWFALVFFTSYFIVVFFQFPKERRNKYLIGGVILSLFVIFKVASTRFIFVKYALPLLLFVIYKYSFPYKKKIDFKYVRLFLVGVIVLLVYGVISEINKLSVLKGDVDVATQLISAFASWDMVTYWIDRQLYRIVTIWTILGGNIIDYVHVHGFMYGLTFIKPLSIFFGFEYISLPLIVADIIGASYAQPGIVAEGYANFGIIGGVINCFIIFVLAELLWNFFRRNNNIFLFLIYIVCFSQTILDGGTINSVLFLLVLGYISFHLLDFIKKRK